MDKNWTPLIGPREDHDLKAALSVFHHCRMQGMQMQGEAMGPYLGSSLGHAKGTFLVPRDPLLKNTVLKHNEKVLGEIYFMNPLKLLVPYASDSLLRKSWIPHKRGGEWRRPVTWGSRNHREPGT